MNRVFAGMFVGWAGFLIAGVALADSPAVKVVTDTIPDTTVSFDMVQLPAGEVTIKDKDGKDKTIKLKAFAIEKFETRWDEFDVPFFGLDLEKLPDKEQKAKRTEVLDAMLHPSPKPFMPPDKGWGRKGSPVLSLNLLAVENYIAWLNKKTGKKYRLPTEAEWEYACRAGGPPVKMDPKELKDYAWFANNANDTTHPSGEKKPNAWGIYDMLGNVSEWVKRADGSPTTAGGSYMHDADDVHSGAREDYDKKWNARDPNLPASKLWLTDGPAGFRLVRED